jgi:23S rRNA pseudouridine955/2504/2580 synthase
MAYGSLDAPDDKKPGVPHSGGVQYVEAGEGDAGQRLDNFLIRVLKGVPRTHVYRLLRKGEVRVNSKRARPDQRLAAGDRVRLPPIRRPEPPADGPRPASTTLQKLVTDAIVYEDPDLLVINKPAGIAVHGGSGMSHGVIEALRSARPDLPELDLVHRLDRETSGCLIVAKKRSALRDLHAQLREGTTEKRYLALVCGKWNLGTKRIELALDTAERRSGERHVAVRPHGKMAVSTFKPVQFFSNVATLMEVLIDTGKTHQIRVHAAYAGHPVAGDDKYGDRERNAALKAFGLERMFLHAAAIEVLRPGTREPLHVSAPLDAELHAVIDRLAKAPKSRSAAARHRPRSTGGR